MDIDTVFLALRVVVALGAVFGALYFTHRWITKGRPGATARNKQIAIVARQGLGAKAGIAIVDAAGRRYLLGVTEHAVTVLDTLGPVAGAGDAPVLVGTEPVAVARFEQELRTVTLTTGMMPVLVHGRPDPHDPTGPITQTVAITRSRSPIPTPIATTDGYATRRELRAAEQRRVTDESGPLAGSVLSPATWKQTAEALKRLR